MAKRTATQPRPARRSSAATTYWSATVALGGGRKPAVTFGIPANTLKGVRKGKAAVKAALDIMGIERVTDADGIWLAEEGLTACVAVESPDGRWFVWSSTVSEFARLVSVPVA